MPVRAPSPVHSENEWDIAGALFSDDSDSDSQHGGDPIASSGPRSKDVNIPNAEGSDGSEDDEQFIALTQAASNRKAANIKGRSVKKGGGFQVMGLNSNLLKAVTRKGFSIPTPIQRRTIPLVLAGQDVVGMARTGSGKTAAFVVPMIEKLKAHSAQVGARALLLAPSRELALQTLKVVKELGRGTDLTATLLVGGDSLEEQFGFMAANPDILIATPGRFLHLKVEMGLDLSSIKYVVFDEADRLFEMGFAVQLGEILAALPVNRQTLLFSATLPKSLVEFARAGLQDPSLVRLDAESKVSPDLRSAFFTVKSAEKEGSLLHLIQDVIKIPTGRTGAPQQSDWEDSSSNKKRKRVGAPHINSASDTPTPYSTLIFAATKHHVEYLSHLLRLAGYAVSLVYGSLDQTARRLQVADFRAGRTHIMVVTDVAARGIDVPLLANVINYDFPAQPKVFVHRVGRTARAGKEGWAYSLVTEADAPYLLDLQLFLGRRLIVGREEASKAGASYNNDITVGSFPRDAQDRCVEAAAKLIDEDVDLSSLRSVAIKGEKLYRRSRSSASVQSARRAKQVVVDPSWASLHTLFVIAAGDERATEAVLDADAIARKREQMLASIGGFRPQETVFEIGRKGQLSDAGEIIKKRRGGIVARKQKARDLAQERGSEKNLQPNETTRAANSDGYGEASDVSMNEDEGGDNNLMTNYANGTHMAEDSDSDLSVTIHHGPGSPKDRSAQDSEMYMSYTPKGQSLADESAYRVGTGASHFLTAARSATLDLGADEGGKGFAEPSRAAHQAKRWDRKSKKYIKENLDADGRQVGPKSATIIGESGARLSASFRSGRFDAWMKSKRMRSLPRIGETEKPIGNTTAPGRFTGGGSGRKGHHASVKAPKAADPKRDNFFKQKKRISAAKEARVGRFSDGKGTNEIKGLHELRKERAAKDRRKEKNGPGLKGRKGRMKGKRK